MRYALCVLTAWLLDCLDGSVPDPGHHLRVAQVDAAAAAAGAGADVSSQALGGRGGGPGQGLTLQDLSTQGSYEEARGVMHITVFCGQLFIIIIIIIYYLL